MPTEAILLLIAAVVLIIGRFVGRSFFEKPLTISVLVVFGIFAVIVALMN